MADQPHTGDGVRVRFAPSPTGYLHVGGARTAIFNWLWARHTGGAFVLRIEDTDAERSSEESEASLIADLEWLGLDWDEGPVRGGPHSPYRQTERLDVYREAADELLKARKAYPCFCTDEELEEKREAARAAGRAPHYDGICRDLTAPEIEARRARGLPEAIRFRVPAGRVSFDDIVRGDMDLEHDMVGDFVILRSNGLPTYNFAAAVDDARMGITHVIRGEEHLSNTLRQILVLDALGAPHPRYVHVPLILAEDRSKLSKRHGSSSVAELRDGGFVSDAVFNYLVLLGWSHPESEEVLSREQLVAAFTLDRIGRAAAVFDPNKLRWMNGQHIRAMSPDAYYAIAQPYLPSWLAGEYSEAECRDIALILQDAVETLADLPVQCAVFAPDVTYEPDAKQVLDDPGARGVVTAFARLLGELDDDLTPDAFKKLAKAAGKETGRKGKELFFPLRAAITGNLHGPDLSRVASVKGRSRVARALQI
jgi:nondiscriminating glutamyl-tRNA synthetase